MYSDFFVGTELRPIPRLSKLHTSIPSSASTPPIEPSAAESPPNGESSSFGSSDPVRPSIWGPQESCVPARPAAPNPQTRSNSQTYPMIKSESQIHGGRGFMSAGLPTYRWWGGPWLCHGRISGSKFWSRGRCPVSGSPLRTCSHHRTASCRANFLLRSSPIPRIKTRKIGERGNALRLRKKGDERQQRDWGSLVGEEGEANWSRWILMPTPLFNGRWHAGREADAKTRGWYVWPTPTTSA